MMAHNISQSNPSHTSSGKSRVEFSTVYDVIDKLETMVSQAKPGIFTPGQVRIDREEFTADLTELKQRLPVQLERASALMREAEHRLNAAQTQADAIISGAQSKTSDMVRDAREQAQYLAGQENVVAIARGKATEIVDKANARAAKLTTGADEYSAAVMRGLDEQLDKLQHDVQAGLKVLADRRQQAGQTMQRTRSRQDADSQDAESEDSRDIAEEQ